MTEEAQEYQLSKRIPARTKTVKFRWACKNFMQCTERYLAIRNRLHHSRKGTMTHCDWCKKPFEIDEWFGLAQPLPKQEGPKRNWALCLNCADAIGAPER